MPDPAPLFSVVIPAHNREKLVGAALCSVAGQTFKDWECIVVDDGSTDGTGVSVKLITGILQGLAQKENTKMPDIRLIRTKNGGPGAARNAGAAQAKGKYLAFLDSDDVWMLWALETYRDALEKAGWPEYLAAATRSFEGLGDPTELAKQVPSGLRVERFEDPIQAGAKGGVRADAPRTVVSRSVFLESGGFAADRLDAEDHDLALRLGCCRGMAVVREPFTVARRRHGDQETGDMGKAVGGLLRLVSNEKSGKYPGGPARARDRRAILCAHIRPLCAACVKARQWRSAWRLYLATLGCGWRRGDGDA